jgi:hypothetical protein
MLRPTRGRFSIPNPTLCELANELPECTLLRNLSNRHICALGVTAAFVAGLVVRSNMTTSAEKPISAPHVKLTDKAWDELQNVSCPARLGARRAGARARRAHPAGDRDRRPHRARQLDRRANRLETLAARAAQPQGPITPEFLSRTIGRARMSGFLRQHSNIKVPSRAGRSVARWGI